MTGWRIDNVVRPPRYVILSRRRRIPAFFFRGNFDMNYVLAAYAVVWLVFFAYVFRLGRKISKLERDLSNLRK